RPGSTFSTGARTTPGPGGGAFWRGACAIAPDHNPMRVAAKAQPAAISTTATPVTTIRFFITVPRGPCRGPPGLPPSTGDPLITSLFICENNLLTYRYGAPS